MKKILLSLLLIFVGFVAGIAVGSLTAGYGGGVAGICIYNDVALNSKIITEDQSKQLAKEFAKRFNKSEDKKELKWLIENTDISESESCTEFFDAFKKELKADAAQGN